MELRFHQVSGAWWILNPASSLGLSTKEVKCGIEVLSATPPKKQPTTTSNHRGKSAGSKDGSRGFLCWGLQQLSSYCCLFLCMGEQPWRRTCGVSPVAVNSRILNTGLIAVPGAVTGDLPGMPSGATVPSLLCRIIPGSQTFCGSPLSRSN